MTIVVTTSSFLVVSDLMSEISQTKPFASLEEEVFLNLQRTAYLLKIENDEILRAQDLSSAQYNVLRILRGAGDSGLTCSEISERMLTNDSDMTRLLDRLMQRKLINRTRDKHDKRAISSKITVAGLKILEKLDSPVAEGNLRLLGHLGRDLLEQLNALLVLARRNTNR